MSRAPPAQGRGTRGEGRGGSGSRGRYLLGEARAGDGRLDLADWSGGPLGGEDAAQEGRCLIERLLVLEGGIGVGDDAAAGLDVDRAVLDQRRAQRDGRLD